MIKNTPVLGSFHEHSEATTSYKEISELTSDRD